MFPWGLFKCSLYLFATDLMKKNVDYRAVMERHDEPASLFFLRPFGNNRTILADGSKDFSFVKLSKFIQEDSRFENRPKWITCCRLGLNKMIQSLI